MYISQLMEMEKSVKSIGLYDILELEDSLAEVSDWLAEETVWEPEYLMRIAAEAVNAFVGTDGVIDPECYEEFRFLIAVFPVLEDGSTIFDLMDESQTEEDWILVDSLVDFLLWMRRQEFALDPTEEERIFEYALSISSTDAICGVLNRLDDSEQHEVIMNIARMDLYDNIGDEFFEIAACVSETTAASVMKVLSDSCTRAVSDLDELYGLLNYAHDMLEKACELAGVEMDELEDLVCNGCDCCGGDDADDEADDEDESADKPDKDKSKEVSGEAGDVSNAEEVDGASSVKGAGDASNASDGSGRIFTAPSMAISLKD